jgi:protein-S-isoprenylcysteine O-methyltransferase Ste14
MLNSTSKPFKIAALKQLGVASVMLVVQFLIFILFAGEAIDLRLWLYIIVAFVHYSLSTAVQYQLNPQLLVQRLKRTREGSKTWDEVLMRVSNLMVIIAIPAIAGWDSRVHDAQLGGYWAVVGLGCVVIASVMLNWAMVVNPHFEPTVRIQLDRGHQVVTGGPYAIIRHPGYFAGIVFTISIPLILGFAFAFVPVGTYILLMVLRTWLEDRTLQDELAGYAQYARQVRYRLLPGFW